MGEHVRLRNARVTLKRFASPQDGGAQRNPSYELPSVVRLLSSHSDFLSRT